MKSRTTDGATAIRPSDCDLLRGHRMFPALLPRRLPLSSEAVSAYGPF